MECVYAMDAQAVGDLKEATHVEILDTGPNILCFFVCCFWPR